MGKLNLSNSQRRQLQEIVASGFDPNTFQFALNAYLGRNVWDHASGSAPFPFQIMEVVNAAEREWWSDELLVALRSAMPRNQDLFAFADGIGVAPRVTGGFERLVTTAGFMDLPTLIEGLTAAQSRVCKVEVGRSSGTGFLVGPDLVLTNHHVVAPVLDGAQDVSKLSVRFDYRADVDGGEVHPGTPYGPAGSIEETIPCSSPPSPLDADPARYCDGREGGELDFALVVLDGRPGELPPAGEGGSESRGWFCVADAAPAPEIGDRLLIVQHPAGEPLAVDVGVVERYSADRRRVLYDANTRPGSSGAPCFDGAMNVVALHHVGDPSGLDAAEYNAGIPIGVIRRALHERGFDAAFAP